MLRIRVLPEWKVKQHMENSEKSKNRYAGHRVPEEGNRIEAITYDIGGGNLNVNYLAEQSLPHSNKLVKR